MIIQHQRHLGGFVGAHVFFAPSFIVPLVTITSAPATEGYSVVATDMFVAGPVAGEVFIAGPKEAEVFNAGVVAGEVVQK